MMKTKHTKLIAFFLVAIGTLGNILAHSPLPQPAQVDSTIFSLALELNQMRATTRWKNDLNGKEKENYKNTVFFEVYDYQNNLITEQYLADTSAFYRANNTQAIAQYCTENVKKIVRVTETIALEDTENMKTVDNFVSEVFWDTTNSFWCEIDYEVRGSITYDPNTYIISSATDPVLSSLLVKTKHFGLGSVNISHQQGSKSISTDRLSATFFFTFKISGVSDWADDPFLDFGWTECSFRILPD